MTSDIINWKALELFNGKIYCYKCKEFVIHKCIKCSDVSKGFIDILYNYVEIKQSNGWRYNIERPSDSSGYTSPL